MTADEQARVQAAAMYAADAASRALGITVSGVAVGRATATMTVGPRMVQGHGTCHGGYLFLLADTAFAFACNTRGAPAVAAGASVEFLAPAGEGDELVAEAVERVVRGRSGVCDVTGPPRRRGRRAVPRPEPHAALTVISAAGGRRAAMIRACQRHAAAGTATCSAPWTTRASATSWWAAWPWSCTVTHG